MSDTLSTCWVNLSPDQDRPGSVPIAVGGMSAGLASESSFTEGKARLGSRGTLRTGHCCVGRWDQDDGPSRTSAVGNELSFGLANRCVSGIAGHRGLGQEPRLEVLDGDQIVSFDHASSPLAGIMLALTSDLLLKLRGVGPGRPIPLRRGVASRLLTASHLTLIVSESRRATSAMLSVGQIVGGLGCGGSHLHAPVDSDFAGRFGPYFKATTNDERYPPVPNGVAVDGRRPRCGRQATMPDDWERDPSGNDQTPVAQLEPVDRVFERRQGGVARLELRSASPLHLEERLLGFVPGKHRYLLGVLRTGAKPFDTTSPVRQLGAQVVPGCVDGFLGPEVAVTGNALVPHPPTTIPLGAERGRCLFAWPKPVGVPHDLHVLQCSAWKLPAHLSASASEPSFGQRSKAKRVQPSGHSPDSSDTSCASTSAKSGLRPERLSLPMAKARGFSEATR